MGVCSDERKPFYQKDNHGNLHDTFEKAQLYWLVKRPKMNKMIPFILYQFNSSSNASSALLELPFIHRARDTNNLICDRIMEFGYYKVEESLYEAIIAGSDLTLEEYKNVENCFKNHGGWHKNHLEPSSSIKSNDDSISDKYDVKFVKKYTKNECTYECYEAKTKADAMKFLGEKEVTQNLYFIIVDTPEGNIEKNKNGIYEE